MNGKGRDLGRGRRGCGSFTLLSLLLVALAEAQPLQRAPTIDDLLSAIARRETNVALRILETNPSLANPGYRRSKEPLHEAAAAGNVPVLRRLVELGADLNAQGDSLSSAGSEATALHVAIRNNQPAAGRWLLEAGANPNLMAFGFTTPLHLAFTENREEIAGWLLEFGADPFQEKHYVNNRTTPFELAITRGSGRLVPQMLGYCPRARGATNTFQVRALKPGDLPPDSRVVRLLATNGPNLLVVAAQRGQLEAVEALLNVGVKPPAAPADGYAPLQAVALSYASLARSQDFNAGRWARIRELLERAGAMCDGLAATGFGDLETARRLLAADRQVVRTRDFEGATPLHWAVRTDRLPLTSFWIESGASTSVTNLAGQTPLHLAAAKGLTEHVRRLLAANAPTQARDTNGWTPLDAAMQTKQAETIRLLLASTPAPPTDRGIAITLHEAAAKGNIAAMTQFATPANLEARNELGFTPLHLAAQQGQLGAAAFLLDKGANVNARDAEGNTVLHLILLSRTHWIAGQPARDWIERKQRDARHQKFWRAFAATSERTSAKPVAACIAFFLGCGADAGVKNKAGKTALQIALDEHTLLFEEDRAALLSLFASSGGGLDARDRKGETALHRAARELLGDNAEALVAAGADLNATNRLGRTPLHAAVENLGGWGESEPFVVILKADPNVNAQDKEGLTPLHLLLLSESSFQREATEALLAAGADPNLRDKRGRTALLCALAGEWPWRAADASLGQLVAAGAKTDTADNQGNTALHYLARMGHQSPMFFIRDAAGQFASLDVNATNRAGDTPLHVAARAGTTDVFDWLRSRGARLDVVNAAGKTPPQLARRNPSPFARLNYGLPAELANAAQRGEVEALQRALKADPSLLHATNTAGETALRMAARSGQTNLAVVLVEKGAEWDAVSATLLGRADVLKDLLARNPATLTNAAQGKQLIHLAAESGDVTILESLLSVGADVEARARPGLSPLGIARLHNREAAVAMLRARDARENLFDAVVLDLPDRAAALLARNPSLGREFNQFEFTPMHLAVALERPAILKLLLDEQMSPDIPAGSTGISPLHVAAACNRTNAIALLVQRGAKPEVVDEAGFTPLHYAAGRGVTDSAAILLALGAKPDVPASNSGAPAYRYGNSAGSTALHLAVWANHSNIVALLLEAGANVNATNAFGLTPLDLTRSGMPMTPPWLGPLSMPGIKLATSFRSMGLPQLADFFAGPPMRFNSSPDHALATVLQRAGGSYGTATRFARPR